MHALTASQSTFCEVTYDDVKALIHHTVLKFVKKHGGDYDELLSSANLAFLAAYDSFNSSKGMKFSSWVCFKVQKALLTHRREDAKRFSRTCAYDPDKIPPQLLSTEDADPALWDMSEDARELVSCALSAPLESRGDSDALIDLFLDNKGWSWERLTEGWKEIQEIVSC